MTRTRQMSWEFQKLLETTIFLWIEDLRKNMGILHFIGEKFEETGMCSPETLRMLKEEAYKFELM